MKSQIFENSPSYIAWRRKRRNTTIIACFIIFLYGLEIMSVAVSVIYYVSENFNVSKDEAGFYFAIIETIRCVVQSIAGITFGRYTDKTRNLKAVMMINMFFILLGNLLYSIPFHLIMLVTGRILCGMSESLQTAFSGEFRRCYSDEELIKVLGWYEVIFSFGTNLGPGMIIIFSNVDIQIGAWTIYKYNSINVIICISTAALMIATWFYASDMSKEYDELKIEHLNSGDCKDKAKELHDKPESNKLIKWKDVLQIDIFLITFSYGISRFTSRVVTNVTTLFAAILFNWTSNTLSLCHMILGFISYAIITVFIKTGVFKGNSKIFYFYVLFSILAAISLIILTLPRALAFTMFSQQAVLICFVITAKNFVYFSAMALGKFLLLNTVDHKSSGFIDGFRSLVGNMFRLISFSTVYTYFEHPMYVATPLVILQLLFVSQMLYRRDNIIKKKFERL